MSIPVYCATSKLSNFFQTSSSFLPNVTPHRNSCSVEMNVILMLFFGLLADAVHLAIAGGNTQPEKFISLFCLWSFLLNTEITLPFTNCGKFLLVSLINECQTKVATYFTQTDCQGNDIVLLSSKIGGTFPP